MGDIERSRNTELGRLSPAIQHLYRSRTGLLEKSSEKPRLVGRASVAGLLMARIYGVVASVRSGGGHRHAITTMAIRAIN